MTLLYIQSFSSDKNDTSLYPNPKLFDIFLYPTLVIVCKYNLLIKRKNKFIIFII